MTNRLFSIKYKPGIRMIISIVCVLGILGGSVFSIYYAMRALYESSLKDASTILFLDLEARSQSIADGLLNFTNVIRRQDPIAEFKILNGNRVQWLKGEFAGANSFGDIGIDYLLLDAAGEDKNISFSSYNGESFYATRTSDSRGDLLRIFTVRQEELERVFTLNTKHTVIYILNRAGKLIYTNNKDINPENVTNRPLVGAFIKMPFRQGQSEFKIAGDSLYGFFQEIPRTNMVIFAEKTKSSAMRDVYLTIRKVAAASFFYLAVSLLLLQVPLWKATKPIRALTEMAAKLAKGDFDVSITDQGFGELAILSRTFIDMSENLKKRDKLIAALHVDKLEKTKMEQGIRVASTIQERFLFKPETAPNSRVQVAAKYEPSLHLAGDWYGVFNDESRGETIVSIVDITGHGIESAMMTPVMSVLFQEQKARVNDQAFDIRAFLERCNSALYAYGAGISTATGIIAKFNNNDNSVVWLNAGHPQPVIVGADGSIIKSKGSAGSATLLGFSPKLDMIEQKVNMSPETVFAIFSDGLMTVPAGGSPGFSRKDLFTVLKSVKKNDVNNVLSAIMDTWRRRNANIRIEDDMCLVLGLVK